MVAQTTLPEVPTTSKPPVPLTTIFTPPPSCLDVVTYDGTSFWQNGISQTGDDNCYPSGFSKIYGSWYTPGICPQSWTSVGTNQHPPDESNAMCCPSSYFLQTTNVGILLNACASLISSDLTNVWSTSTLAAGPLPTKHPLSTVSKADIASNTVWADVIQVRWHSTNPKIMQLLASESMAPSSSRSSGSGSSASASGSVSPSITSLAALPTLPSLGNSNQDNSGGGLSSGAKAGIGIGVALGVVILAAVAAFLFFRRRRRGNKAVQHDAQGGINPTGYHEMEHKSTGGLPASEMGHKHPAAPPPAEMDGGNIGELSGAEARAELDHR